MKPVKESDFLKPGERKDGGMIIRSSFLSLQVCVPKDWATNQIEAWTNAHHPCGTSGGWKVRTNEKESSDPLDQERVNCADEPDTYVHVVLDA